MPPCLGAAGHEVEYFNDPNAGLSAVLAGQFDVVLLDLMMPVVSGLDILKQIKEGGAAAEVVMITGHATVETAVEVVVTVLKEVAVEVRVVGTETVEVEVTVLGPLLGGVGAAERVFETTSPVLLLRMSEPVLGAELKLNMLRMLPDM